MKGKILLILFCILLVQTVLSETEITVTEEELVRLSVDSEDPDNDESFVVYTEPVNNKGIWQTEVGDAGTYYINVTVCDREYCDLQTVKLVVLPKAFAPNITFYSPEDLIITMKETDSASFNVGVEDMDSSKIYISWEVDGKEVSNNLSFQYSTDHYSAGHHTVRFTVSDGELQDQVLWDIDVEDVNAPPVLEAMKDIKATEGDLVKITPEAADPDNDIIIYTISEPIGDDREWQTGFDDEGEYEINITASDGSLSSSETVRLIVEKNDRVPIIIEHIPENEKVYAKEGEEILFSLRAVDEDGDEISYEWSIDDITVGDEKAIKYTIDYDSAGVQIVKCSVSDGIVKVSKQWTLIIEDVNQPPVLELNESYIFNENDLVRIVPAAVDPDGDDITFSFSPPLDENGEWQTDHKSAGTYTVNISAYDGENISSQNIQLTINNIDAPPVFEEIADFYVDEGINVSIKLHAYDPDEEPIVYSAENLPEGAYIEDDTLKLSFGYDTVKRHTGWFGRLLKTLRLYNLFFSDSKNYKMKIAAESGDAFAVQDLKIIVLDKNRAPVIEAQEEVYAEENELVKIDYSYYDPDDDNLKVELSKPLNIYGEWQTDFEDSGTYNVSIKVDDNLNKTEETVQVFIENKNREPFLSIDDYIKVRAGKEVKLEPKVIDLDDDNITISYSGWMESDTYLTNENDTGIHTVTVEVSDGIDTATKDITVEVKGPSIFWFYAKFVLLGLILLAIIILIIILIGKRRAKKKAEMERLQKEKERLGRKRLKKVKELMGIKAEQK
ncbi:PKD domain-containing protein [Candidatus Woesearchaeota archaeon]|nr:PKD domain-containing protein [Candidatus Woesearchaeota archaeon]